MADPDIRLGAIKYVPSILRLFLRRRGPKSIAKLHGEGHGRIGPFSDQPLGALIPISFCKHKVPVLFRHTTQVINK